MCSGGVVGRAYAEVTCVLLIQEARFSVAQDGVFRSGHLGSFQVSGPGLTACMLSGGRGLSHCSCTMRHILELVPTDTCTTVNTGHRSDLAA